MTRVVTYSGRGSQGDGWRLTAVLRHRSLLALRSLLNTRCPFLLTSHPQAQHGRPVDVYTANSLKLGADMAESATTIYRYFEFAPQFTGAHTHKPARECKTLQQGLKELLITKSKDPWDKEVEFQRKKYGSTSMNPTRCQLFPSLFPSDHRHSNYVADIPPILTACSDSIFYYFLHIHMRRTLRISRHIYGCKPHTL